MTEMTAELKSYSEIYIPENQGKQFRLICPNCKSDHMSGDTMIFVWCRECCWLGHGYECLFKGVE